MLKCVAQALVASSVLCAGFVTADDSVELQGSTQFEVIGVIKPMACNVNFTEGNIWDYGVISAKEIEEYGEETFRRSGGVHNMNVSCESPASVRIRFVDALGGAGGDGTIFGFNKASDGKSIGFHYFQFHNDLRVVGGDGKDVPGVVYGVSENQASWKKAGGGWVKNLHYYTPINSEGFPVPFKNLTTGVHSKIAINKGLGVKDEQEFHGVVTMELYY